MYIAPAHSQPGAQGVLHDGLSGNQFAFIPALRLYSSPSKSKVSPTSLTVVTTPPDTRSTSPPMLRACSPIYADTA